MHIFNLNTRPHLILTHKELLFRHEHSDEEMQRHRLEEVEKVSIQDHYDDKKEVIFFLSITLSTQSTPVLLPLCDLDSPIEELLEVLSQELDKKVRLSLPSAKWVHRKKNRRSNKKLWLALLLIFCLGLYPAHKMILPSLDALGSNTLRSQYEEPTGLCSANAKAAFASSKENMIEVKYYCAILGLWQESSSKTIQSQYLEAEFSTLDSHSYIQQAKEHLDNNQSTKAADQIANALYLNPKSAQAYLLLSKVQSRLGFTKKALSSLLKASSLDPASSAIAAALASLYLQEKEFKEAYVYAKRAAILETNAANLITAAKIEVALDMREQAIKHFELSLQKDPNNLNVLHELGTYYRKQKDFAKAAQRFQKLYALEPHEALNFFNYYEMTLITPMPMEPKEEKAFVDQHKDFKEAMMIYDMLQIIRLCIHNADTQDARALWTKNYANERLAWSFETLRDWLDDSQLDIEHIQYIQNTIGFFIGYQRAYNLNHDGGSL